MSGIQMHSGPNSSQAGPFKGKRGGHRLRRGGVLPEAHSTGKIHVGVFTGRAVVVSELESLRDLHRNGCFGVSSITKSTPVCLWNDPVADRVEKLLLFPEEAFFLHFSLKCLEIRDKDDSPMSSDKCLREFVRIHPGFISSFVAYSYLRTKNWIIKSGIKFGGDFLIYHKGPEFFHATFLVLVRTEGQELRDLVQLQCIHRVSHSSGKDVLLLEVSPQPSNDDAVAFSDYLANQFSGFQVVEFIPKRFIMK